MMMPPLFPMLDEDRCKNAQKLESAFYSREEEPKQPEPSIDDKSRQLLELINQSPELAEILIKTLSAKNG